MPGWIQEVLKELGKLGGIAVVLYILAEAWVSSVEERVKAAHEDARIAIRQASDHGLSLDSMQRKISAGIDRKAEIETRIARLESANEQGPRFTLNQGLRLEDRVSELDKRIQQLERFHLTKEGSVFIDKGLIQQHNETRAP